MSGDELASVYDTSYSPESSDLSPPGLLDSTGPDSPAPDNSSTASTSTESSVNEQGSISLEPVYPSFLDESEQTTSQSSEILSTSHEESLLVPEAPTADPAPGNYNSTQLVNLRSSTVGASVYYTTDGSDPDPNSFLIIYPLQVDHNLTIKAVAVKDGVCSPVSSFNYVIAPEPPLFSLAPGQYDLPQQLIISTGNGPGSIYYTLDGSEPSTSGMLYREPINIDRSLTVRALVYLDGQTGSEAVASYVIGIPSPVQLRQPAGIALRCMSPCNLARKVQLSTIPQTAVFQLQKAPFTAGLSKLRRQRRYRPLQSKTVFPVLLLHLNMNCRLWTCWK
jgi:hypothetical protein